MRLLSLALLVIVALCNPGWTLARATPSAGDVGTGADRDVPDPERTPDVMKLLGVSLAGAEFSEQRLPDRVNFDYVYPTDRAPGRSVGRAYRLSSAPGCSSGKCDATVEGTRSDVPTAMTFGSASAFVAMSVSASTP